MRPVRIVSLAAFFALSWQWSALAADEVIDFPCTKNLVDGRVLVDGPTWERKMKSLGYVLEDGAYVPYKVLNFTQGKQHDPTWADGECRMQLMPVVK